MWKKNSVRKRKREKLELKTDYRIRSECSKEQEKQRKFVVWEKGKEGFSNKKKKQLWFAVKPV
jgi:ribosomal protein L18